jgi:hypothetical protein
VLRLDPPGADEAAAIAGSVRDLLITRKVIGANDRRDELWQPSAWMPGPRAHAFVDPGDGADFFLDLANNGVDIRQEPEVHHPGENDEEPTCPHCAAGAPLHYAATYDEWLETWATKGREPSFTCDRCGWTGLAGDWAGEFSPLVGAPAVTFHNWPPLLPSIVTAIRVILGGRTGVVHSHW